MSENESENIASLTLAMNVKDSDSGPKNKTLAKSDEECTNTPVLDEGNEEELFFYCSSEKRTYNTRNKKGQVSLLQTTSHKSSRKAKTAVCNKCGTIWKYESESDLDNKKYVCGFCTAEQLELMSSMIKMKDQKIKELQEKVNEKDNNNQDTPSIKNFVKEKVQEEVPSLRAIIKDQISEASKQHEAAVEKKLKEQEWKEKKKYNVIMKGVKEGDGYKDDIEDILSYITGTKISVEEMHRMGKKSNLTSTNKDNQNSVKNAQKSGLQTSDSTQQREIENQHTAGDEIQQEDKRNVSEKRPRPIRIKFRSKEQASAVLNSKTRLRECESWENIYLEYDLNYEERKKRLELIKQMKEARTAGKIAYLVGMELVIRQKRN